VVFNAAVILIIIGYYLLVWSWLFIEWFAGEVASTTIAGTQCTISYGRP
jgi:hypothetical protein